MPLVLLGTQDEMQLDHVRKRAQALDPVHRELPKRLGDVDMSAGELYMHADPPFLPAGPDIPLRHPKRND
jgi:hypothetical protein